VQLIKFLLQTAISPLSPSLTQYAPSDAQQLLIGNKCDCEKIRVLESESGEQLARSQGIPFLETSAKTNHNIDEVRVNMMWLLESIIPV